MSRMVDGYPPYHGVVVLTGNKKGRSSRRKGRHRSAKKVSKRWSRLYLQV